MILAGGVTLVEGGVMRSKGGVYRVSIHCLRSKIITIDHRHKIQASRSNSSKYLTYVTEHFVGHAATAG